MREGFAELLGVVVEDSGLSPKTVKAVLRSILRVTEIKEFPPLKPPFQKLSLRVESVNTSKILVVGGVETVDKWGRGGRKTLMPPELNLTQKAVDYAVEKLGDVDVGILWERFTSHHLAVGSRFANWEQAWRTWVLRERSFAEQKRLTNGGGGGTILDRAARVLARQQARKANDTGREHEAGRGAGDSLGQAGLVRGETRPLFPHDR